MKKPSKIIFVSGSPRKGNTEFLLEKIFSSIETADKEIITLKDKNIYFCRGCLACHTLSQCAIKDDMGPILEKIKQAKLLVLGSPNYFDNVSGLMKNFIDRCHPLYKNESARGKKTILLFVGGGKTHGTKKFLSLSFFGFIKYLKLDLVSNHSFQALHRQDLSHQNISKKINLIVKQINLLLS